MSINKTNRGNEMINNFNEWVLNKFTKDELKYIADNGAYKLEKIARSYIIMEKHKELIGVA